MVGKAITIRGSGKDFLDALFRDMTLWRTGIFLFGKPTPRGSICRVGATGARRGRADRRKRFKNSIGLMQHSYRSNVNRKHQDYSQLMLGFRFRCVATAAARSG
jgi:hypothetical protein